MPCDASAIVPTTIVPMDGRRGSCPDVVGFCDKRTSSIRCVVSRPSTGPCAAIDPALDFDPKSGSILRRARNGSKEEAVEIVKKLGLGRTS